MIERLRSYAAEQMEQDRVLAVLLDEAQDLTVETLAELAALSRLRHGEHKLLQIVLVGRPELEAKLRSPELQELVALWCRLEPLRADEVKTYIDRRLSSAGYRGKGLFEAEALDQIAVFSKGIPAIINVLCDNALFTAYTEGRPTVSVQAVQKAHHTMRFGEEREGTTAVTRKGLTAGMPQRELQPWPLEANHHSGAGRRHARSSRQPLRTERSRKALSPSTAAAAAGIVLLIASAAMLYTEPKRLPPARGYPSRPLPVQPANPLAANVPGATAAPAIAEERPQLQVVTTRPRPATRRKEGEAAVYVHMSEERDRAVAEGVGDALRNSGYFVSYTRTARGRTQGDVRFFFRQDRVEAERIRSVIETELARLGYPISLKLLERDGGKFEFAGPGKIEVWLPPLRSSRS
jgi:hypothetical protein